MDLLLLEIDVVHGEVRGPRRSACLSAKEEGSMHGPWALSMTSMSLFTSLGFIARGSVSGSLSLIVFFKSGGREDVLLHEEVEKSDDGGHPGLHGRDVHAPVSARVR